MKEFRLKVSVRNNLLLSAISYEKQIVVDLLPGGMITADEFHHAATGA